MDEPTLYLLRRSILLAYAAIWHKSDCAYFDMMTPQSKEIPDILPLAHALETLDALMCARHAAANGARKPECAQSALGLD